MKIEKCSSYLDLSAKANAIIISEIKKKPNLLLCAATGKSPTGTYHLLENEYQKQPKLFDHLRVIKLDEWGGIKMNNPSTCETYLQLHLIRPLNIPETRYSGFSSNPEDPQKECARIQNVLDKTGPIDLCILGIGMNGHLALNEPNRYLQPNTHVVKLSAKTLEHKMLTENQETPAYGLTLGMADIMNSKMILLLINGSNKTGIVKKFLTKKITSLVPASFLWLHPNVVCFIEKEVLG